MPTFIDQVLEGIKTVAPTVANIALPGSGTLVEGLMRAVTGDKTSAIEQVAQQIMSDPKLMADLQMKAMDTEVRLAQISSQNLQTVNSTMQAESKSEKWPQYSWRPFNGFTYPLAVNLIYFLLPLLNKPVPAVPEWIWVGWLCILGVATWDRGKQKRAEAGDDMTGLLSGAIKAIKNQ